MQFNTILSNIITGLVYHIWELLVSKYIWLLVAIMEYNNWIVVLPTEVCKNPKISGRIRSRNFFGIGSGPESIVRLETVSRTRTIFLTTSYIVLAHSITKLVAKHCLKTLFSKLSGIPIFSSLEILSGTDPISARPVSNIGYPHIST